MCLQFLWKICQSRKSFWPHDLVGHQVGGQCLNRKANRHSLNDRIMINVRGWGMWMNSVTVYSQYPVEHVLHPKQITIHEIILHQTQTCIRPVIIQFLIKITLNYQSVIYKYIVQILPLPGVFTLFSIHCFNFVAAMVFKKKGFQNMDEGKIFNAITFINKLNCQYHLQYRTLKS